MSFQRKPIVDYVSLTYYYQMNPPQFIYDMLKRIENRNSIQIKTNRAGKEFVAYGITSGEKEMLERFKTGNFNPRGYGTKNEEFKKGIKEGLNLPKKKVKLSSIPKASNTAVIEHFVSPAIHNSIKSWGVDNLKIVKYPTGFGLMNYKTLIAFRTIDNQFYISTARYSSSTSRIQYTLRNLLAKTDQNDKAHYVSHDEVYRIANVDDETKDFPFRDRGLNESRKNIIKQILRNEYWTN